MAVLNNSGYYGADGRQWPFIGQIADDSTWRDNILAGKFKSPETIPGWGRRVKVRIMGVHDQEQETIPDDQLPWALIEYPTTAGSGGANSFQTIQLRQGMTVTGYFMDGADQNVPIITGVMGQNAQTGMQTKTGMTGGEAFESISGFAKTKEPYKGSSGPKTPEHGLKIDEESKDTATPPPGAVLNKFGIAGNPTVKQLAMIASGIADGNAAGLTGAALDAFTKNKVSEGISNLRATEKLATRPPLKNATVESPDSVHLLSAGDIKRDKKMCEKIVTMKPDDIVQSSMKAIQTVTENLSNEIEAVQDAIKSYTGAVSAIGNPAQSMQKLIGDAACEMAKYMKIIFDKVMNYVMETLNANMTKVVSSMPASMRYQMSDMKETISELTLCMYGKITDTLCGTIAGLLNNLFNPDKLKKDAERDALTPQDPNAPGTYAAVSPCTAEEMVGEVFALHAEAINSANNSLIDNVNSFLDDIQSQLSGISGAMSDIMTKMGGINGSMTSALGFANIKLNVFGCELKPAASDSDYYTLCTGGSGSPQQKIASNAAVSERANKPANVEIPKETPFSEVPKGQSNTTTDSPEVVTGEDSIFDLEVGESNAASREQARQELDMY